MVNSVNGESLTVNDTAAFILAMLSNNWLPEEILKEQFLKQYHDVDEEQIKSDISGLLSELNNDKWVYLKILPYPDELTIELTQKCNERCLHCYIPETNKKSYHNLPLNLVKKAISDFINNGGVQLAFTGGEIFLYKHIDALLDYLSSIDIPITLLTNLTLLTDAHLEKLRCIKRLTVRSSLYSHLSHSHNTITHNNTSFSDTINNIRKLKDKDIHIKLVCVLMRENMGDIVDTLKFIKSIGISPELEINFMAMYNGDDRNLSHRISINELETVLRNLKSHHPDVFSKIAKKNDFTRRCENAKNFLFSNICSAGRRCIYLNSLGQISPCSALQSINYGSIGNSTIYDCINSNESAKIHSITNRKFSKCLVCEDWEYCPRCIGLNYAETGDFYNLKDYWCNVAKVLRTISEK